MNDSMPPPEDETHAVRGTLRAFRRLWLEPAWDRLDRPDATQLSTLWSALRETGLTIASLREDSGSLALDAASLAAALAELGAAVPALAAALVSHLAARDLLQEAGLLHEPAPGAGTPVVDSRLSLVASPLDARPQPAFRLARDADGFRLTGAARTLLSGAEWLLLPAQGPDGLALCVVRANDAGLAFRATTDGHGLRLLPRGELRADDIALPAAQIAAWPVSGRAANLADGLLAAALGGMAGELAGRAAGYAHQRRQGGKAIGEHDAVQQLIGPIEIARRPLHVLAIDTLRRAQAGDGSATAFAAPRVRQAALDAIQVFGGYGYMTDCRVERYLRDANNLETSWIHSARRERALATQRCAALAHGEAA